jgi:hypothetical protein
MVSRSCSSGSVSVGSKPLASRAASGPNAQSTVAYQRLSLEPKRALMRLWLTPSSRLSVRTDTPS